MDGEIQFHYAKALETLCQSQWLGTISKTLASHSSSFLAGEQLYILTSPEDVTAAYKIITQLTFDRVVYDLSITFGVTNAAMDKAYRKPTVDDNTDFYKQQLHSGNRFDLLQSKFWHYIDKSIRTENLSSPYILSSTLTEKSVSLQSWCQNILLNAGTQAFFGEKILGMDPDLMQNFLGFRCRKLEVVLYVPSSENDARGQRPRSPRLYGNGCNCPWVSVRMRLGRLRQWKLHREQLEWMSRTSPQFWLWCILCMKCLFRNLSAKIFRARGSANYFLAWHQFQYQYLQSVFLGHGINHLLPSTELYETIRAETATAIRIDGGIDVAHLHSCCAHLESLFNEVLRFASASSSAPSVIGGKRFPTGARLIFPFSQLHCKEAVYGDDTANFNPDRFMRDKSLACGSSYRLFGGGTSYYPGRFIARQEVYYVATWYFTG